MIGLLGASGKIGSEVRKALMFLDPDIQIKCGCRRVPENVEGNWQQTDVNNEESFKEFITDCDLLINASGMTIKQKTDIPVVEIGDDEYYRTVKYDRTSLIYGCGAVPGIIGIIPRILAKDFDSVQSIRVDYLINEPITETAALDMASSFSITGNDTAVFKTEPEKIPFLCETAYRYRFADEESKGIDKILGVKESEWSMVRESDEFEQLLSKSYSSTEEFVGQLCKLSKVKQLGRENSIGFITELKGTEDGKKKSVLCYAHSPLPHEVSAKSCASVAYALYKKKITDGVYRMSLCPECKEIWDIFEKLSPFDTFITYPCSIADKETVEEGEL